MPIELILSPIMRPVVLAKSLLFAPHRRSSRYIPHIIQLDEANCSRYAIRRRFGTGSKIFDVYDTKEEGSGPSGPTEQSKGAYKMYSNAIRATGPNGEDEPCATLRAGLRSNVLLIRAPEAPVAELGWHVISHRVDALDAYRMFTLADGATYQWTTKGKYLERVKNVGEKESEVVPAAASGFDLIVDDTKIPREMALASALCSFIDHWNTNIDVGGIYYARQPRHVRWKRD
ncbi:hypothetical protein HII13_003941 [Brettanomyces bruxellensis]|nr:hypothetical protein HII13_003941 [Brettanomyces bruxellensis]